MKTQVCLLIALAIFVASEPTEDEDRSPQKRSIYGLGYGYYPYGGYTPYYGSYLPSSYSYLDYSPYRFGYGYGRYGLGYGGYGGLGYGGYYGNGLGYGYYG